MAQSLFDRIGGQAAVARLVFAFYDRVMRSPRLAAFFRDVEMRRLVEHQAKFVSQVMGGPLGYSEAALAHVHAHLGVDDEAFDEMMQLFEATLRELEFQDCDVREVMAGMRAHRRWVVTAGRSAPVQPAEPMPTGR